MNALFTAIATRWTAMMAGRAIYNTSAMEEATLPYATMTLVSDTSDWTFAEDFEDCLIQFNLFSGTPTCEEVGLTFEALKIAFDKHDLAIEGGEIVSLERIPGANLVHIDSVWQYIVTYRIYFQV